MSVRKFSIRCPSCRHGTMHYGEAVAVRGEVISGAFSCRGCGAAWEPEEIQEIVHDYLAALKAIQEEESDERS